MKKQCWKQTKNLNLSTQWQFAESLIVVFWGFLLKTRNNLKIHSYVLIFSQLVLFTSVPFLSFTLFLPHTLSLFAVSFSVEIDTKLVSCFNWKQSWWQCKPHSSEIILPGQGTVSTMCHHTGVKYDAMYFCQGSFSWAKAPAMKILI